ncbi:MAG: multicopper oxidase domain-containing protein, partial [Gemmatimonadota bacterium]
MEPTRGTTMNALKILAAFVAAVLALGALSLKADGGPGVDRIDFGVIHTATRPAFDARLEPASDAPVKEFRIPMTHETIEIASGVHYEGWTFGGTVPGPALRVRQGDLVRILLVNESPMGHSIDLHSARIPMNEAFRTIPPGGELTFEFEARDPGVFLVHCGTPPVLMHIMQGMYLAIVVDPEGGWGNEADREFVIVQSEFYARDGEHHVMQPDWEAALEAEPTQVAFNGRAFQYK